MHARVSRARAVSLHPAATATAATAAAAVAEAMPLTLTLPLPLTLAVVGAVVVRPPKLLLQHGQRGAIAPGQARSVGAPRTCCVLCGALHAA